MLFCRQDQAEGEVVWSSEGSWVLLLGSEAGPVRKAMGATSSVDSAGGTPALSLVASLLFWSLARALARTCLSCIGMELRIISFGETVFEKEQFGRRRTDRADSEKGKAPWGPRIGRLHKSVTRYHLVDGAPVSCKLHGKRRRCSQV